MVIAEEDAGPSEPPPKGAAGTDGDTAAGRGVEVEWGATWESSMVAVEPGAADTGRAVILHQGWSISRFPAARFRDEPVEYLASSRRYRISPSAAPPRASRPFPSASWPCPRASRAFPS